MKPQDFLEIDYTLLLAAMALSVFGILFIYSSGITAAGVSVSTEYVKQIIWAAAGLLAAILLAMLDYRKLYDLSIYCYAGILILLAYTCLFGKWVSGARAWIGIGAFGIQPSEFAKIITILVLARYLDASKRNKKSFTVFFVSSAIVFIPMLLVLLQPDFGTSLVFIPILLVMTFIAGLSLRYVLFLTAWIGLASALMVLPLWQKHIMRHPLPSLNILFDFRFVGIVTLAAGFIFAIALFGFLKYKKGYFYWISYCCAIFILSLGSSFLARRVLKEYQIMRLIVFMDPNVDPRGAGWNIIQSITAIGSGGLWGKGYLQGTHSHYRFLPEQSTDFIFSIFSEEWGLIGGLAVFALFLLICLRLVRIMKTTIDFFGASIASGLAAMYSFHFLINVGMAMGIMPVTGIPLFFMSYGGSSLISAMIGIGLSLSIYIRRYRY
ncbi:MAG: rod shape-determining protein RodA [Treponema sp.]|jgi:rod shape determining protein RodA|nr:rod shape-determining protein RodA [Treponema sp.]